MNKKIVFLSLTVIIIGSLYLLYFLVYEPIGNSPNYKNVLFCPIETRTIIDKYNINKSQIENCQSKSFNLNGRDVKLIHLEYGVANDCPAGCFFSHYCAIFENGMDYPYVFYFTNPNENILGSATDWRVVNESILTGRRHDLALTQEFNDFLGKEVSNNGEFRWCAI